MFAQIYHVPHGCLHIYDIKNDHVTDLLFKINIQIGNDGKKWWNQYVFLVTASNEINNTAPIFYSNLIFPHHFPLFLCHWSVVHFARECLFGWSYHATPDCHFPSLAFTSPYSYRLVALGGCNLFLLTEAKLFRAYGSEMGKNSSEQRSVYISIDTASMKRKYKPKR